MEITTGLISYLWKSVEQYSDPASGYSDFNTPWVPTLIPGSTYNITLSAGIDPGGANESWKIWIDFNGNNDFSDPGEEVVSYVSNQIGWETSTFTVPSTATAGTTRMRVSLKNGSPAQTPCETFALGEVEDYTVILSGTTLFNNKILFQKKCLSIQIRTTCSHYWIFQESKYSVCRIVWPQWSCTAIWSLSCNRPYQCWCACFQQRHLPAENYLCWPISSDKPLDKRINVILVGHTFIVLTKKTIR